MIRLFLLSAVLSLVGCSTGYAPVFDQSLGVAKRLLGSDEYRVRSGDTLMAIAFRFGIDHRKLASINGIENSDLIFAGQVLKIKGDPVVKDTPQAQPSKSSQKTASKTKAKSVSKTVSPVISAFDWQWPHPGKVLARYSKLEGGNKGLDLSGQLGDPVKAAAPGQVVYAGSGLLGYGNLVIISHNEDYLSAYAHNSNILVTENQQVKAGQTIAELGSSGATVPMLHFEIRKDGKPVDPQRYLPRR